MSLNVKHIYEHGFATPEHTGSIFCLEVVLLTLKIPNNLRTCFSYANRVSQLAMQLYWPLKKTEGAEVAPSTLTAKAGRSKGLLSPCGRTGSVVCPDRKDGRAAAQSSGTGVDGFCTAAA
jgi:hypothetical protein